ncbi:MAG: GlsB/YeaQ/YmgE family stress response membrane protein [Chloroflexi bacterium]|nr:GlsB/YeaQ/YmgE family stress response membrane protein [Chloroflexota bacterium]
MYINLDLNNLILTLVVGLIAGFCANALAGRGRASWVYNLLLGIAGAFLGGILLPALGLRPWGLIGNLISAIVGSVIILMLVRIFSQTSYPRR